jgi:hypothetical protein
MLYMSLFNAACVNVVEVESGPQNLCLRIECSGATDIRSDSVKTINGGQILHLNLYGLPKDQRELLAAVFGNTALLANVRNFGDCGPKSREPLGVTLEDEWDNADLDPVEHI